MSKEVRCIMFAHDEVQVALGEFLRRRIPDLSPYALSKVELSEQDGAVCARVTVSGADAAEPTVFDSNELMAAVLMHCRACRIPLSNRSKKKIELSEGRVVLVMSMNLEFVQPTVVAGAVVYQPVADSEFVSANHHAKRFAAAS